MTAYYNENDPKAAAWLRELIRGGHIAPGDVDERSILDVSPTDLVGYGQCHFFAGIGGWSLACRLAGIPDDEPLWTGSCPCQPFSAAGKGAGESDARHLWPAFYRLIAECRPPRIAGEQVASALGRVWLTAVRADLEELGYGVGAADLCAASVGAPHIRQRLYWMADAEHAERGTEYEVVTEPHGRDGSRRGGDSRGLGNSPGGGRTWGDGTGEQEQGSRTGRQGDSPWSDLAWLPCRDGKARPTQPGLFPLAHGVPGRVGLLRGYGNAIVPEVAAAFLKAALSIAEVPTGP